MPWIKAKDRLPEKEGYYRVKVWTISMNPSIKERDGVFYKTYKNRLGIECPFWRIVSNERVVYWFE